MTFLFTDIEGSTRLWQADEVAMRAAVARHDELLQAVIAEFGGRVFSTMGDGVAAVFSSARDAILAAQEAQTRLDAEPWPTAAPIRVRMGVHSGEAQERNGDYFGTAVNRAARLMAVGHGGQVLCSAATVGLAEGAAPLVDLDEHRLRDLDQPIRIYQIAHRSFPPLRSLEAYPGNLPTQPNRFVGREADLERIKDALAQSRLVTLTGVGGVGKTRLALQSAAEVLPAFPDGAWVVELAGLVDASLLEEVIAEAVGLRTMMGQSTRQALAEFVSTRRMLVVLDNCEHLIEGAAASAEGLLSASTTCRILATSREGLGVPGERVIPVPTMTIADDDGSPSDAVALLVERIAEAGSNFRADKGDAPVLVALCRRLDGIPLGIELAAARARSMAPAEILTHLDQRFRLLSAGRRTAPTRQQTLRSTLDWSYELLDDLERTLLRRLSIFVGGFDLVAVEAVVTDDTLDPLDLIDLLDRLVDKSLVSAEFSEATTRYRLLETIRDYGLERLDEADETRTLAARHAGYFAGLSQEAGTGLRGPDEAHWDRVVEENLENLRAALRWTLDTENAEVAVCLVAGLAVAGPHAGIPFGAAAAQVARLPGAGDHPLHPLCFASASWSAMLRGEPVLSQGLSDEALAAARVDFEDQEALRVRAEVVTVATSVALIHGVRDSMESLHAEALTVSRALGDPYYIAHVLMQELEPDGLEESVRYARVTRNPSTLGYALAISASAILHKDPEETKRRADEAIAAAASVHNEQVEGLASELLVRHARLVGEDPAMAADRALDHIEHQLRSGSRFFARRLFWEVAICLHLLGRHDLAYRMGVWLIRFGLDIRYQVRPYEDRLENQLIQELTAEAVAELIPEVEDLRDDDVVALCRSAVVECRGPLDDERGPGT